MPRRLVFALVFTVLVLGLLLYGIFTHREAGFLQGAPLWVRADVPLLVNAVSYRGYVYDVQVAAVGEAVEAINAQLGFDLLVLGSPPKVSVEVGAVPDGSWRDKDGYSMVAHRAGTASVCIVKVKYQPTMELAVLVVMHELLHCFGLAHDEAGIMRLVQRPGDSTRITDHDRQLLRETYGSLESF